MALSVERVGFEPTHTIDLTPFNMTGEGDWSLNLINGWASSGSELRHWSP